LTKIAPLLPYYEILKISMNSFGSPCYAELIGVLLVKIGRTVEKLFMRGVFDKNCSLAPPD
jgi:hypothetical protein